MTRSARHYTLTDPERGRLVSAPPDEAGPGQLLVRVAVNGVCASDLPTWLAGPGGEPLRLGHEPAGTVVACGPGVELAPGTRVTGRIVDSYAEIAVADARDVVEFPDGLDPLDAVGEPLGCVVDGLSRVPLRVGDRVAVIGLGYMGRIAVRLLLHSPLSTLVAVDVRDDAVAAARADGADAGFDPGSVPADLLVVGDDPAPRAGCDVVVEATGSQAGLDLATAMVRHHGVIAILGYHQGVRRVDLQEWNWKAIDVVNAHVRDRDRLRESTRRGLELAAGRDLDLAGLVTHRYTFDRIDDAFRALRDKPPGFVKALIDVA